MNKKLAVVGIALITILCTWSYAQEKPQSRRYINLPRPNATTSLPFSHGVIIGDTLYISGTLGLDPKTGKPPADSEQETHMVMDGIVSVLKEANMTPDDLVSVTVYCSDLSQYQKFNGVYR